MKETLAQITSHYFCCGILLREDIVVDAAPIVGYMRGWTRGRVRAYVEKKRWAVSVIVEKQS